MMMKETILPTYTSSKEELSIFYIHKLQPPLERSKINQCHLSLETNEESKYYSHRDAQSCKENA